MEPATTTYRLYQYQTDAMPDVEAGDWVIQKIDGHGEWRNFDGPYKYRDVAALRLKRFESLMLSGK